MKVNLNYDLKDLDGQPIKNSNAGHIIANMLSQATDGDPVKYWGWALKLKEKKDPILELDKSDAKTLRDFVEHHKGLPALTKAQVMDSIDNPKSVK